MTISFLMPSTKPRHPEERADSARLERPKRAVQLPRVIGHRGAAARAPENTLAGFRRAKALGCTWVEFDVRLTADGVLVLCHDPKLDRTTNGAGLISTLTLAEVRRCDAGPRFGPEFTGEIVPTLDEALLLCAEIGLGANIEMKADPGRQYATAAAVTETLRRLECRLPTLVSSFDITALAALRRRDPDVPLGLLFRVVPRDWSGIAQRLSCAMIGADHRRLRRGRIAEIRAAGYQVAAYTVNDPARARRLYDWGVSAVFSDTPDVILLAAAGDVAPLAAAAPLGRAPVGQGAIW